jgi:hypothetical protein
VGRVSLPTPHPNTPQDHPHISGTMIVTPYAHYPTGCPKLPGLARKNDHSLPASALRFLMLFLKNLILCIAHEQRRAGAGHTTPPMPDDLGNSTTTLWTFLWVGERIATTGEGKNLHCKQHDQDDHFSNRLAMMCHPRCSVKDKPFGLLRNP